MEISQISLAIFVAAAFIFGFVFGFLYDFMSPLPSLFGKVYSIKLNERFYASRKSGERDRRLKKAAQSIAVFLHDLLYMICFGAAFATLTYVFNDGIVRISSLAASVIGLAVYRKTLRGVTLALSELARFFAVRVVRFTARIIALPLRLIRRLLRYALERIRKACLRRYSARYSKKMKAELISLAKRGFVLDFEINENNRKGKCTHERRGKKEKNNNICDIVHADGIGDRFRCESDELQSAPQGSHSSRAQKRRA